MAKTVNFILRILIFFLIFRNILIWKKKEKEMKNVKRGWISINPSLLMEIQAKAHAPLRLNI